MCDFLKCFSLRSPNSSLLGAHTHPPTPQRKHTHTHTHTHTGLLFQYKKGDPTICDNMNGLWGHYTQSEIGQTKTNTVWSHLYGESKKKKKNSETENRLVGARGGRILETGNGDQEVQISS